MKLLYKFDVYTDKKGDWQFRVVATNKNKLYRSGEGYKNRKECAILAFRCSLAYPCDVQTVLLNKKETSWVSLLGENTYRREVGRALGLLTDLRK